MACMWLGIVFVMVISWYLNRAGFLHVHQQHGDRNDENILMFPPALSGLSEPQVSQMMEHVEKLIMTRLHKWVFCHDSCDDEQKDLTLQRRIK